MIFKTLIRFTRKLVRDHMRDNGLFALYRYSGTRRAILAVGDNPLKFVGAMIVLYTFCILLTDIYLFHAISWDIPTDSNSVLGDLNLALMASQAAIFGMVYPMIIGLVAQWTSRRALNNFVFDSYLTDAFIKPLGVSGLALLFILVVNAFMLDQLDSETYFTVSILNALWFVANLVGTAHFLWVTREYLRTASFLHIVKRYSVNIAWRRDFEARMKRGVWASATHSDYALLPNPEPHNVDIMLGYGLGEKGSIMLARRFARNSVLADVRFRILGLALKLWIRKEQSSDADNQFKKPTLTVPVRPDFPLAKEFGWDQQTTIVSQQNLLKSGGRLKCAERTILNWLTCWLLPLAFKFKRRADPMSKDGAGDILEAYSGAVITAIQANNTIDFEQYWDETISYHGFLLNLCREGDQSTPYHNLAAKLGERPTFSTRPISVDWAWFYDNVFEEGVNANGADKRYFRRFCYGTSNLLAHVIEHAPKSVITDIFMLHTNLQKQLGFYWQGEADAEGLPLSTHVEAYTLTGKASIRYPDLCRHFIAGWESVFSRILGMKLAGGEARKVAENHRHSLQESYLARTAFMLARSVSIGDMVLADWIRDSFMRALQSVDMRSRNMSYLATNILTDLITQPLLADDQRYNDWTQKYFEAFRAARHQENLPDLLKLKALENYHKDLLLTVCLILIEWGGTDAIEDKAEGAINPSLMIVRKILDAEAKDQTGRGDDIPNYFRTPADIMACFLRIMASGDRYQENTYRNQVNDKVQSLERLIKPDMISGRIYSSSHYDDVQNYPIATLVLLLFLSPDNGEYAVIQAGWQRCFDGNQSERMRNYVQSLLDCLETNIDAVGSLYQSLKDKALSGKQVDVLRLALTQLVEEQRDGLRAQIIEARIRLDKIQALVTDIGSDVLATDLTDFPVSMFRKVSTSRDQDNNWLERGLRLDRYEKGRLTAEEFAHGAINEAEAFRQSLLNANAGFVWQEIVSSSSINDAQAISLNELSELMIEHALPMEEPLLLFPFAFPEWIENWLFDWSGDVQLQYFEFQRQKSKTDHQGIGRLVHRKTGKKITLRTTDYASQAMLFDASTLKELRFLERDNEALFNIEFDPDKVDPTIGALKFKWKFELITGDIEFVRIAWQ